MDRTARLREIGVVLTERMPGVLDAAIALLESIPPTAEHRASAALPEARSATSTAVADLPAAEVVSRNSSISVGRDALGNVFVTGDGNTVEVKLTVVVADSRLQAPATSTRANPYRGLYAFRETDSELFFGRDDLKTRLSHDELLAAAGPGKYRLDAVDEYRRKVDGVPVALTGPLSADEDDPSEDDSSAEIVGGSGSSSSSAVRPIEDVLCQVVNANTRMVEKALGQIGTVMSGVAELLNAAHNAGITSRMPPPPPPAPPPPPIEYREDDDEEETAPTSGIPDFARLLIKEAVDKVVPLIFEKITSGSGLGGLPLEALLDWRKAAPNPAAAPSAPAAPDAPSAPPQSAPASWHASAATASHAASSPSPPPAPASHTASSPPPPSADAPAGAAPGRESPPGAAPAATPTPTTPAASSSRTQEDAAAAINAHVLQIWQGLTPPERARAGQLIARLTAEERTAWLAELARLTVPEAITRARAIIHAQSAPTPAPQLPTTTPHGDPS